MNTLEHISETEEFSARLIYLGTCLNGCIEDCNIRNLRHFLEDEGADPNVLLPGQKFTPFHTVAGIENEKFAEAAAKLILIHNGNPNVRGDKNLTPVQVAASRGHARVLCVLLEGGGSPWLRDELDKNTFDYAKESKDTETINVLSQFSQKNPEENNDAFSKFLARMKTLQIPKKSGRRKNFFSENVAEFHELHSLTTHDLTNVSNATVSHEASRVALTEDRTSQEHSFQKSNAHASLVAPEFSRTITGPSTPCIELTQERLEECNSQSVVGPGEHNYVYKRVQRWMNHSPLATSSDSESNFSPEDKLNTAAIGSDLNLDPTDSSIKTCATVSECFEYVDKEKGIVLLEERWLANSVPLSDLTKTGQSFIAADLYTNTETVDPETLRKELESCGIHYGPVTATIKKEHKHMLHKKKTLDTSFKQISAYSYELQRTFRDNKCMYFMIPGARLEEEIAQEFASTGGKSNWREGNSKTSFTYLLLDPLITNNLPCRAASLHPKEVWAVFLQSIFSIGKGKRSRPYYHLYEAVESWKKSNLSVQSRYASSKVKRISEIWMEGLGVISLHVFQNVIPVEAYTREAAMIDAIGVQNLSNMKRSDYYGKAAQCYSHDRNVLGVYLLYKALKIFLSQGERHLSPFDIV